MSKLSSSHTVTFFSDGTDSLTFDLAKPPVNIAGKPDQLVDADFRTITTMPTYYFLDSCVLEGTKVTAKFTGPLPEDYLAVRVKYSLSFTLVWGGTVEEARKR